MTISLKEKAKELVNRHYSAITGMELSFISKLIVLPSGDSNYETAKKCALITVNEIIDTDMLIDEEVFVKKKSYSTYWQQVKQEIEKL